MESQQRSSGLLWTVVVAGLMAGQGSPGSLTAGETAPWRQAGLSERQAAAHCLDRLTFGARPGDVDRVLAQGLQSWIEEQLASSVPDSALDRRLTRLESLNLPTREFPETYPDPALVLREAIEAGVLPPDFDRSQLDDELSREEVRRRVIPWARERGYRLQRQLVADLMTQKLYRALYSENQLAEVLTDFWFNHFNVSLTDNHSRVWVLAYERDAIRPYVLGDFRQMLGATARHPAMLLYLDNARSTAGEGDPTTLEMFIEGRQRPRGRLGPRRRRRLVDRSLGRRSPGPDRPRGLNENYARELLELHTLGVDGGYTQEDVVETARAFTGWTVYPPAAVRERVGGRLDRALGSGAGFVAEGGFLFRADVHDAGQKQVLGRTLRAGRGIEDGEEILDLLARHPSTAQHLATKIAVRFVADRPPPQLVERLARTFRESGGDVERVMRSLLDSPEFWSPANRRQKIKSPFELAVSALRAIDAEVRNPREVVRWIGRMGQSLYAYQAPTGHPDRADYWVNTGSLINRMNFGLALASGRVRGVRFDLLALNGYREPESRRDALRTYLSLLLPERELGETHDRLEPMVLAVDLATRVAEAAPGEAGGAEMVPETGTFLSGGDRSALGRRRRTRRRSGEPTPLEQIVGLILGSPEFQRR